MHLQIVKITKLQLRIDIINKAAIDDDNDYDNSAVAPPPKLVLLKKPPLPPRGKKFCEDEGMHDLLGIARSA
ncbi:MAG: hypothetical protein HY286_19805 [Planctomycetes bacterium]|nr:hypothetical protein [Planctomycetota bacterium]